MVIGFRDDLSYTTLAEALYRLRVSITGAPTRSHSINVKSICLYVHVSFVACVTAMQLVSQDVGGPCWTRPQAVCERSLAALTIENPPTSSTLTFVCGGPLESLRMSS